MNKKLAILVISCLAVLGTFIFVYPILKGYAQIAQEQKEKQDLALQTVRGQPLSNSFFETLVNEEKSQNVSSKLKKAFYFFQPSNQDVNALRVAHYEESFLMFFEQDKVEIRVTISRFESDQLAMKTFGSFLTSQGRVESLNEFGDEGRKVIRRNGKLGSLSFRRGSFTVSIGCDSEKIARRFAEYALKAIDGQ
ncbi:MAG: hypothetical protein ACKVQW_05315 [Pyrinomonadaceae bacterium]